MIYYKSKELRVCFFDADGASDRTIYDNFNTNILSQQLIAAQQQLDIDTIILAKQVHGDSGIIIDHASLEKHKATQQEADFLVTNISGIALGVYTADCVPVIFFDTNKKIIGLAHAGWPGTSKNISGKTINAMEAYFSSNPQDIEVFIGPSCKPCCYEVGPDFIDNLMARNFKEIVPSLTDRKNEKIFFDLPGLNHWQMRQCGIKKESIHTHYNDCTICNLQYCSYRRDKNSKRQITIIALDMT